METKVLIVEDDLIVAEDLKGLLCGQGYLVPHIACSGPEALQIMGQELPDLAFLDITLSGNMTGVDVAGKLNELGVPFIFLTAHTDKKTLQEAINTKPYGYLVKPFSAHEIKPTAELAIYRHKAEVLEKKLAEREKQLYHIKLGGLESTIDFLNKELSTEEKQKRLQLAATNSVLNHSTWSERMRHVAAAIKEYINWEILILSFHMNEAAQDIGFAYQVDEHGQIQTTDFDKPGQNTGSKQERLQQVLPEFSRDFIQQPTIYDQQSLTDFMTVFPQHGGQLNGFQSGLFLPVQLENIGKGWIFLALKSTHGYLHNDLDLLVRLVPSLSIAMVKAYAQEALVQREKEKSILLKISNQLSLVNDRKELWALVSKTLKEIINFDVGVVATLERDGKAFRILLSTAPRDMNNNPEYKALGAKTELLAGSPFEYIFKKEGVFEFHLEELELLHPNYLGVKMMREYGLLHTVGIKLCKGDDFIGQAYFHFNNKQDIDSSKFGLLKSIGELLSIVVANIMVNEQIQEKEQEKSLQVEVVNAITSTKNKTKAFLNLANVINKVIPFHTFSIAFPFDIDCLTGFKKNKQGTLVEWHNVQEILAYANIDLLAYQNMLNEIAASGYFSKAHICIGKEHEALCRNFKISALHHECIGARSALYLPFLFHGQNISVHIYLNSQEAYGFTEKDLKLLQVIVSPLSLALENLFAFEDIEQREREKSILLNLSNAINNIKDKQKLWVEIVNQLQPVFGFERDFTFVYLITPDREHYRFFLLNKSALDDKSLAFGNLFLQEFPIKGAPYEEVMKRSVWMFAIENMMDKYPHFKGFKQGLDSGQRQTAIIRLEHGGEVIGSLHLNAKSVDCFNDGHIPLLEAIGKQISIAIANILANDKIERQLKEITGLKKQLEAENEYLQEEVVTAYNFDEIIGISDQMQQVYNSVSLVAGTDSTVLLLGETGTGKELIARAIHNTSKRKNKLLVKVNCATLPANLIESELFGHERGSFTGATERRIGKFELANNGTLFLDEIGELPIELQAKLLRALQEKEIERIGGKAPIKCDVRIIAATNRNLEDEVKKHKFRNDLFFRLNIFPINLPPLRERKEDIPLLAKHFLQKFATKMQKKINSIDADTLNAMMLYHWPGNIRELENVVERAVIITKTKSLRILLSEYGQKDAEKDSTRKQNQIFQVKSYKDAERELILKTLEVCNGKIRGEGGAAELLKIKPTTLESKMKKLGLVRKMKVDIEG